MSKQTEDFPEKKQWAGYGQVTDINKKLIFNMRDVNHIMRSLYEGKASQKRILIMLKEIDSITQRDLTMRLGIQPGSASEILSKLENAGLILRTMSETDRRTANISLTEQGKQMAEEAAEQRNRRHVEMFSCLSGEEKEELLVLLEKLNADWAQRYGMEAEERRQKCRRGGHGCEHGHGHEGGHGHEDGHGHESGHGHEGGYGHGHGGEDEHGNGNHPIETEESEHVEVH